MSGVWNSARVNMPSNTSPPDFGRSFERSSGPVWSITQTNPKGARTAQIAGQCASVRLIPKI